MAESWRWRPGSGDPLISRRAAPARDLADLPGWNHDEPSDDDMDVKDVAVSLASVKIGENIGEKVVEDGARVGVKVLA